MRDREGSEPGAHILSGAIIDPRASERAACRNGKRKGAPIEHR
jgi:hypothetical protein